VATILAIARQLSADGLHEEAIIEYRRAVFFGSTKGERAESYYFMGTEYSELEQWENAEQAFEQSLMIVEGESLKAEVTLALASTYIVSNKPSLALLTMIPLLQEKKIGSAYLQALLLSIIAEANQQHWKQAMSLVDELGKQNNGNTDSMLNHVRAILAEAEHSKPVHPETAKLLSTMLPGAGQFYSGDVKNGLHALALNGINFWVVLNNLLHTDYISAVLYAVLVTERYYAGNRYHAEKIAMKVNETMQTNLRKNILSVLIRYAQEQSR
ncbi:MAG: tetratricopeptide repeat protein, partial [Ignavibacteriae bacterium]|nr:tetratricopeptide repeat protein [Ignavibacteriota bacterium]